MKKWILPLIAFLMPAVGFADESTTIKFSFPMTDISEVVGAYSKASGQKFILDPSVHGKITIINDKQVTLPEAFNELSAALALNSVGIVKQNDIMIVMPARSLQRDNIEVVKELPPLQPEKMYTWIINLKNVSADSVNKELRILSSKDGEVSPFRPTNSIVVSDWSSNLQRIAKIIAELDTPAPANIAKFYKPEAKVKNEEGKVKKVAPRFNPKDANN